MITLKTTRRVILLNAIAIFATVAIAAPFEKVYRQFEDGGFITYFSVIQLFILSYFTGKTFKVRSRSFPNSPWKSPVAIWGIMSLGFSFLALDDLIMIHEWIDKSIHKIWQIQETGLSDRIDDLIVGFYGLLAIGFIVIYRHELKKYIGVLPAVITAFTLMFMMVGVDVLTNRDDILLTFLQPATVDGINSWVFVLEEGLKLLAEGFYIVAAHACLQMARRFQPISQVELSPSDRSKRSGFNT